MVVGGLGIVFVTSTKILQLGTRAGNAVCALPCNRSVCLCPRLNPGTGTGSENELVWGEVVCMRI